jgi:hypothetical protein
MTERLCAALAHLDTDRIISIFVTWPRLVRKAISHLDIVDVFMYKLHQCTLVIRDAFT